MTDQITCPNCGAISDERYLPEDPREHPEGFGWRCSNCGLNIGPMEGRENALAAWAMPAARAEAAKEERAKVRELILGTLGIWRDGHCYIVAQDLLAALDMMEKTDV